MKRICTTVAVLLLIAAYSNGQPYRIGMIGGPHQSNVLENRDVPGWDTMKNKYTPRTGLHFGFIANLPLGHSQFYFQPGIIFANKGRKFSATYDTTISQTMYVNSSEFINYLDVPFNFLYKFRLGKSARFIIGAGPYVSFFYTGKVRTETITKDGVSSVDENKDPAVGDGPGKYTILDYGANGLAGFEFGRIILTANYSRGLKDFYKPENYTSSMKHEVMGITAGVFIDRLGKPKKDHDADAVTASSPDTDGDGIPDKDDKCPGQVGLVANGGCPLADKDNDGVPDKDDKCPDVAGVKENKGCPAEPKDTDKDGVNDDLDKCPTVAGVAKYNGCPVPDSDGDGLNDEVDNCPTVKGPATNNGCPIPVKQEIVEKVNYAARRIQFQQKKSNLLSASIPVLNSVVKILKENPAIIVSIEGHTSGDAIYNANMKLSQERANKVKAYLVSKGIDPSRLTAIGYGPNRPLNAGRTEAEKAKNRRVELKLSNQ